MASQENLNPLTKQQEENREEDQASIDTVVDEGVKSGDELNQYIEDIAGSVRMGIHRSISILTPWFFNNMPQIYYQTTPREEKVKHLSAIITGHVFETKQTVQLWDKDHKKVTYIGPGSKEGILFRMAEKVTEQKIKMGAIYFSHDNMLFLSTFFSSDYKALDIKNPRITEKIDAAKAEILKLYPEEVEQIDDYLQNLDNDLVIYATVKRLLVTYQMYRVISNHEGAYTQVEQLPKKNRVRLSLGLKNINPAPLLPEIISLMDKYNFRLNRSVIIKFQKRNDAELSVMNFVLQHAGKDEDKEVELVKLTKALRTLAWVDVDEYTEFNKSPYNVSVNGVNLLRAISVWLQIFLGKENSYYYSNYKILATFKKHDDVTREFVELFREKFDPLRVKSEDNESYTLKKKGFFQLLRSKIMDELERRIFSSSVHFLDHALKTNYYMQTKTGLAFRLSPDVLDEKYYRHKPFGIFFIVGRDYRFFQLRWRDIARGGLRVVMPKTKSDYDGDCAGLFDEVYGLSYGQQLKNKDIPEGGSKAVLLLKPGGDRDRAVRGSVNALLDLLVAQDEVHEESTDELVSYYKKEEILYLGPDENMTNELIEWIPKQAGRRGYKYAKAFMSSKPSEGINHKEYGVTSEGVNVYVENTLNFLGMEPRKKSFTVKLTGGPDGDVAGNELKILHREYGENPRVVAIADGFGAAYDPDGLDWPELLRLVKESQSIIHFSEKLLKGKDAFVIKADNAENIRTRNELHFKVPADVFIPSGGRPYTVNDKNWQKFYDEDGTPSCKAVVEGANIFFTEGARKQLLQKGMIIIKDSSANKTGVICSSYEILASLILKSEEFAEIKPKYVEQVIGILRKKADAEAKLLFKEYAKHAGSKDLVELSKEISKEINSVTDAMLYYLPKNKEVLESDVFKNAILGHCPKLLVEKFQDRFMDGFPQAHRIAMVSAFIASHIVYKEGLGWIPIENPEACFELCMEYMAHDQVSKDLIRSIRNSEIPNKEKVEAILKRSAARDLTEIQLDSGFFEDSD